MNRRITSVFPRRASENPLIQRIWIAGWLAITIAYTPASSVERVIELQEAQRFGESIPLLEALLDENPDDHDLNHLYGIALLATSNPALAIWRLGKAVEAPEANLEDETLVLV